MAKPPKIPPNKTGPILPRPDSSPPSAFGAVFGMNGASVLGTLTGAVDDKIANVKSKNNKE